MAQATEASAPVPNKPIEEVFKEILGKKHQGHGHAFADNTLAIGETPLVRVNKLIPAVPNPPNIYVKVEGRNPAYSVKCRVGAALVWDAEYRGLLKPGMTVVEPTSGNTGIALAFVCASRGYKLILTMPEGMSVERRKLVSAFGAQVVLTPSHLGMTGAIAEAERIIASDPKTHYMPQQFVNPANTAIHEVTTGPEIDEDLNGKVDAVVACVGTGGTITGIARYFKKVAQKNTVIVAVEPASSPLLTQKLAGKPLQPGPNSIQGIGANFIPTLIDFSVLDRVETITSDEAFDMARKLATVEGVLCGMSSGAAMAVAYRLGQSEEFAGKNIVVILPDSGERYLSSILYETPAH